MGPAGRTAKPWSLPDRGAWIEIGWWFASACMLCSPPSVRRVWVEIMSMMRWLLIWPMFPYAEGVGNDPVKQKKLTTKHVTLRVEGVG